MNMIEKVARAIRAGAYLPKEVAFQYDNLSKTQKQFYMRMAKAAIEAMREPTEEMRETMSAGQLIEWNFNIDAALKE